MSQNKHKLLLINGPNLNLLGQRNPKHYGRFSLADVEKLSRETAMKFGFQLDSYQSNHEGDLVDRIQQAVGVYDGILINAGALTHYSYSLRDALELFPGPAVEIHISNIREREPFRQVSVIHPVCSDQVMGLGLNSYREGVERICRFLKGEKADE